MGFLKRILGLNASKYYYYVMMHPYNKLQILTLAIIPIVYVPLLLNVKLEIAQAIAIPTILAGIPVALLAMGMANMYGYENRESLTTIPNQIRTAIERTVSWCNSLAFVRILFDYHFGNFIHTSNWDRITYIYFEYICLLYVILFGVLTINTKKLVIPLLVINIPSPQKVTFAISFTIFAIGYFVFVPLLGLNGTA